MRNIKMTIAGRFIDLLGQQMYGGPVPSIAEFIANAWDADSPKVEISIPEDINSPNSYIIIRDYGEGMTFEELENYFLTIGYERRKDIKRKNVTENGRMVMGRKGIGKLAGFGIAEDMVIASIKNKHLVQFTLNYAYLKSLKDVSGLEIPLDKDESTKQMSGTIITLKNLKLSYNIGIESFRKSMSRRFAIGSERMETIINKELLKKEDIDYYIRVPEKGWDEEEIKNIGKIQFWFGITHETIKDSELRGISVFARERVAQFTPFHFNLSGGIQHQVGLEYLTGQVKAEFLDEEDDYISTDRQTINWHFKNAPILEKWGQNKIKELCVQRMKMKEKEKDKVYKYDYSDLFSIINKLPHTEKKDLIDALDKIKAIDSLEPENFRQIAVSMIDGIQRKSIKTIIHTINSAESESIPTLLQAIQEWDVISAVNMAEVISGTIEIIEQLENHIKNKTPEKSKDNSMDMQDFIKKHSWLLGPEFADLSPADFHHERGLDKWIEEEINSINVDYKKNDERDGIRFDLLCIKNDWQILVLELMRPGKPADYDHLSRLNRYVTKIQTKITDDESTNKKYRAKAVYGLLIADEIKKDSSLTMTALNLGNLLNMITWDGLLNSTKGKYRDFFELQKMKAPEDPRIAGLIEFDSIIGEKDE